MRAVWLQQREVGSCARSKKDKLGSAVKLRLVELCEGYMIAKQRARYSKSLTLLEQSCSPESEL